MYSSFTGILHGCDNNSCSKPYSNGLIAQFLVLTTNHVTRLTIVVKIPYFTYSSVYIYIYIVLPKIGPILNYTVLYLAHTSNTKQINFQRALLERSLRDPRTAQRVLREHIHPRRAPTTVLSVHPATRPQPPEPPQMPTAVSYSLSYI